MKLRSVAWLLSATILCGQAAQAGYLVAPSPASVETVKPKKTTISLERAIQKALDNSPQLKSAGSAWAASDGERMQAGAMPNPDISMEVENVAGTGDYRGIDSGEITFGASQLIEVGGKRDARMGMADKQVALASLDIESARLNLIREVTVAYVEAVAASEDVKLEREQKAIADEILQTVTKRVNAAADPLYQKSKAEIASASSAIALDKAERDEELAKQKLAILWGLDGTGFELDSANFIEIEEPQKFAELNKWIENNPDYLRWDTELEMRKKAVELEKANAIPDPSLNVGVRDLRENNDQAFIVGVSVPIPVFNANEGNITKARAESLKVESDREIARREMVTKLNYSWQEMNSSYKQASALKKDIIPFAEESFKLARYGHDMGSFPYLEVLDAQRTLFEVREQYNVSLLQYHISRAEVERLTAQHLNKEVENEK